MRGHGHGAGRRRRRRGALAAVVAPLAAFAPDLPLIQTGDSITALADNSSWPFWANFFAYGRFAMPAGSQQAISGSEIGEAGDAHDVLRADRMALLTAQLGQGAIGMAAIGTNTIGATQPMATASAAFDSLWSAMRASGSPTIAATILPSASNQQTANKPYWDDANAHIRSKAGSDFLVLDGAAAWSGAYAGNTDTGNLHPNTHGAMTIGKAFRAMLIQRGVALGVPYGPTNPSDNLVANWDLAAGTAGSASGSSRRGR